jgi:hypothetical protein
LVDETTEEIHVTVPTRRRVRPVAGVVVHRSGRIAEAVHPGKWPPRTRVEETIVDLIQASPPRKWRASSKRPVGEANPSPAGAPGA